MRSQELNTLRLQLLPLFHSDEDAKSLALRFGVPSKTLRGWWAEEFDKEAVAARGKAVLRKVNQSRGYTLGEPKRCPRCKTITTDFRPSSRDLKRPRSWCTACEVEKNKLYREARTPAAKIEYAVVKKEYNSKYYAQHAEERRECSRQYRASHSGLSLWEKEYYRAHPEKQLLKNAKQRARRFGLPFGITVEDVLKCMPADGRCPITGELFERGDGKLGPRSMSLDRIIPGLGYVPGNIGVISHRANTMKQGCVDPQVFYRLALWLEDLPTISSPSVTLKIPPYLIKTARKRAKDQNLPFDITTADILACIPSDGLCPITREPFEKGFGRVGPRSMSLDRVIPELGYVRGNIAIISYLANTIKQDCTDPEVFRRLAHYLERFLGTREHS